MKRVRCFGWAVVASCSLATYAGADEASVHSVLASWKERCSRIKTVRYKLEGTNDNREEVPPQVRVPSGSRKRPRSATILIDLTTQRYRIENREEIPSRDRERWVPRVTVTSFDGVARYTAIPRQENERDANEPDIGISKGNLGQFAIESEYWPAFEAHGIVPTVEAPLRPDRFPRAHEPESFTTRGTAVFDSRQCLLLSVGPVTDLRDELWADVKRGGAILRRINFNGKNPWIRTEVKFQDTPHGWLPQSWSHTWTRNGRVQNVVQFSVGSFEINPMVGVDDFTPSQTPGMILYVDEYPEQGKGLDTARPAKATYRVAEDGSLSLLGGAAGFTTQDGVQLPPAQTRWWLWAGSVAIFLSLVFLAWKSRRAFKSSRQTGGTL